MIDRCDPEIATWSASGDNFVVKNVEKFASVSKTTWLHIMFGDGVDSIPSFSFLSSFCPCQIERPSTLLQAFELFKLCTAIECKTTGA